MVDTNNEYVLVDPTQHTQEQQLAALRGELLAVRERQHQLATEADHVSTAVSVVYVFVAVVLVVVWLRHREAARLQALLRQQAARLDRQEGRLNAVVEEMAAERAHLADERQLLHRAVERVSAVGSQLRDELGESVRVYREAASQHQAVMEETQRSVTALVVQLQRAARGQSNVEA